MLDVHRWVEAPNRHRVGLCLAILVLASVTSTTLAQTVSGQDANVSRSARLEAARRAAVPPEETDEPERIFLERKLYWFDNQSVLARFLDGWKGVHYSGGDFPTGAGFKFGVGFTDRAVGSPYHDDENAPNRVDLDAVAAYTTRGYLETAGSVELRNIGGAPVHVSVAGGYSEFPQEDFFGLGPHTREADRTNYLLESTDVGAKVEWEPVHGFRGGIGLSRLAPRVGRGTDSRFPVTEALFEIAALPAFVEQPDFRRSNAWLALDWRDNPDLPRAGGAFNLSLADYQDGDLSRFDFRQVEATVDQYVPLGGSRRTLALRATATVSDTDSGQQVPFFYQPTLGGRRTLRGFREFRFRDRNSLLLTAEYRWEAWWALDGALFVDAGKVVSDRADLDLSDLEATYGFGFRFHSNSAYSIRLDLAFSREGFIPFFTGTYGF